MMLPKEDYLAHVTELRDAGKQLMHLFAYTCLRSENAAEKHRGRRQYLETELQVLRLEDLITTIRKS